MVLKNIKRLISSFFILITILILTSCNDNSKKFNFASYGTAEKVPYKIYYNDDYFNKPASEYNPNLASASACLALAGFSSATTDDFSNSDINAKSLFKTLGFNNYKVNKYGNAKPTNSSFGVYAASKIINDYTLIAITVRGAGYLAEWASNFTIGKNEDFAQGFFDASEIYLEFLKDYIKEFNIKGNIKLWTSGYSRGGAAVNVACGRIDDGLVNNINILSDDVSYTKDDIYAYSFEPPAGKIIKSEDNEIFEKGINYSNIFSIINLNDPVPFVAPRNFNFIRYGNDLFLPDIITDLDYQKHINLVSKKMKKMPNYKVVGDYLINTFKDESLINILNIPKSQYINVSPYLYLNDLISLICELVGTKDNYVDNVQNTITELFTFLYSKLTPKDSLINLGISFGKNIIRDDPNEVILYDLQNNIKQFTKDLEPLLYGAFKSLDINLELKDVSSLIKNIAKLLGEILLSEKGISKIRAMINSANVKAIGSAHIPELLLCHITSLDNLYENSSLNVKSSFNIITINDDLEFELTIKGDKYIFFENGNINSKLSIKKLNKGYEIYIPSDAQFTITSNNKISYDIYNHNNKYLNDVLLEHVSL